MSNTQTARPLLDVRGLRHRFGTVTALDDVTFDIADNEFFALLGPSGCGKTTLLRAIAGFEQPEHGEILLDGADLASMPPHRRPVNMMFQSYALFPHLSVEKNVAYGLEAERRSRSEIQTRVGEALEVVGLATMAKRKPAQLSGGQRQRVALARAIIKRPRLLLLDEPLSALDRKVRAEMQLELKRMQREVGMTFVVVTHDQEEAMSMADRIAVLNAGRVEQLDTPVGLYSTPRTRFVADFIGTSNLFDGTADAAGIEVPGLGHFPGEHAVPAGRPASAVLRPEDMILGDPGTGRWTCTVIDTVFLGGGSTVSLAVDGHATPVTSVLHAATGLRPGDRVGVGWKSDRCVIVPGEVSSAVPQREAAVPAGISG
ncbi:ABC transporter ATP-binding protein [Homoserinimonas sp. OAct 916]|uniref:ABC transporter ATP-binding protein n=1 Tax=Homoserinimonas sp. OAct 916 TaxID=2211450 RepID=UPI000DBE687B|nr:ABC transporter ATP-binding protein [Homoserinimonas sp. OAct 916]